MDPTGRMGTMTGQDYSPTEQELTDLQELVQSERDLERLLGDAGFDRDPEDDQDRTEEA